MRIFLIVLCIHAGLFAMSQDRCVTPAYPPEQQTISFYPSTARGTATNAGPGIALGTIQTSTETAIIRVPVVVHILYNNASQNISDAQVKSQIAALTNDFRRKNADTTNTPERFKPVAADVQIEFYLATADPTGRATTGIVHKQSSINVWLANDRVKFTAQGGDDAWDGKSYLNIWVCNLASGSGYSSVPGSDEGKDGIVINYPAFGTLNTNPPHNLGRTAVHETGHWLGLRHIWGDAACGDDGISDTPPQSWYTQGCPSDFRSSCNNGETGDMYMNFMDYTYDACMNLFTEGQKTKMRALFADGGSRASLLQSKGLSEPVGASESTLTKVAQSSIYPNPATSEITLNSGKAVGAKTVFIINSNGVVLLTVPITSAVQKIALPNLRPGLYFIKGEGLLEKFIKL